MTRVHFFQRYSSKENVVTNNTLLLFSRLQARSPELLAELLGAAFGKDVELGLQMVQQTVGPTSVPDGMMIQEPLRIVIETKVDAWWDSDQLSRHLQAFADLDVPGGILLGLSAEKPNASLYESVRRAVNGFNSTRMHPVAWGGIMTFRELLELIDGSIAPHEFELRMIVDDYAAFCQQTGLLPRHELTMRAMPCGMTWEDNLRYAVYYEDASRSVRSCGYLGIYTDKEIRGIGKIKHEAEINLVDGALQTDANLTDDEMERVLRMIEAARSKLGWDISRGQRFTIVDEFLPTRFKKQSSGGMVGMRYFDLGEILGTSELPTTGEVAARLSEHTWM